MGNRVDRIKTNVSESQMVSAIVDAWKHLFNSTPTKEQISLIMAQISLETANRNSMWNFNVGNITTNGKSTYDFYDDLTTKEQIKPGKWKKMNLKYRSYPSLTEGIKDYLRFLQGKHYAEVWKNIVNPNPMAFSKALKDAGYYTANEAPYTKQIVNYYNKFISGNKPMENTSNKSLDNILDNYLQQITASEKLNKKLYKKYLPINYITIKLASTNYIDTIEFANILCLALDEELLSKSFVHINDKYTEVQCNIPGPIKECLNAVNELTEFVKDAFKEATIKIGGINIKYNVVNNKSSYQPIDLVTAERQHRKFLLKFA